jgi:polysaccharide export outer membrane protein
MNHFLPRFVRSAALLLATLASTFVLSRAASTPARPAPTMEPAKTVVYRITPTDKISISVIGEPDLNVASKRIDANGNVNLALLTEVVKLGGLTVPEAQAAVESAYKEGRILRNPQVSINIEEYAPREVSISGMIKQAGKYNLPPETITTLKDIVLRAGGFTDTASGTKVRVSRPNPDGTSKIFIKNIDDVMRGRASADSTDGSFVLEPGDLIYVPEKII